MSLTAMRNGFIAMLLVVSTSTRIQVANALSFLSPSASRRDFFTAAAVATGAASTLFPINPLVPGNGAAIAAGIPSVYEGMSAFAANKVEESITIYDSIIRDDPRRKPYLWQRGLSLYYADRYAEGADQFATDVAVNPNDTEEQIWHLLCLSKTEGVGSLEEARARKLTVGKDRRPVMRLVQKLFLGETNGSLSPLDTEKELIAMAGNGNANNAGNQFYAALYLSLYYESLKEEKLSQQWMVNAVGTEYAKTIGRRDPMVDVAKIAMKRRGWD